MKKLLTASFALIIVFSSASLAQCVQEEYGNGSNGETPPVWGDDNPATSGNNGADTDAITTPFGRYNPATVQTVEGEIIGITAAAVNGDTLQGLHAMLRLANGDSLLVLLGPRNYLSDMGFAINLYDTILVTGSLVMHDDGRALIAAEIMRGDTTLMLRDANGVPHWSHGRRQRELYQ